MTLANLLSNLGVVLTWWLALPCYGQSSFTLDNNPNPRSVTPPPKNDKCVALTMTLRSLQAKQLQNKKSRRQFDGIQSEEPSPPYGRRSPREKAFNENERSLLYGFAAQTGDAHGASKLQVVRNRFPEAGTT